VTNKLLAKEGVTKAKADPADATASRRTDARHGRQHCRVSVGQKVKEGETLLTLEAMKMFAAISAAPCAGTVTEILTKVGESVESKDLLVAAGEVEFAGSAVR